MAAAALLRSMARKLARAAPPPPRPLLAAGLHGGVRSGPGASSPPLTSNQIRQMSGDRLVVGMAATAGLRSGAALPSLATKIGARAPPQLHHPHVLNRGLHSGTTPPPTTDKDKIIEELRRHLGFAKASLGIGGVILLGFSIYGYVWLLPGLKKMRDRSMAFERLEREVKDIIRAEDEHRSVALAQIIQTAGHIKRQCNGTAEKGTRVDKLEEDVMAVSFDILKQAAAGVVEMRADLNEIQAETASMSKSWEQKKEHSRVGSETAVTS